MKIDFEKTACNLCGSSDSEIFLIRGDLNLFIPGSFVLHKCKICDLIYLNPRPIESNFIKIYPETYDQYNFNTSKKNWVFEYSLKKRLDYIKKLKKHGKVLDIGCATGEFLNFVKRYSNFEVLGIEVNEKAANFGSKKYNIEILADSLENLQLPKKEFDIITLWNVIEHVPDPKNTFKLINRYLKDDGYLIFNTPIIDSLENKIFNKYWIGFELPRHFYIFSHKTLSNMLKESGFVVEKAFSFYGTHASFMSSMRFLLRDKFGLNRFTKVLEIAMFSIPFRVLLSPLFFIIEKLNLASIPTFVCRKRDNPKNEK